MKDERGKVNKLIIDKANKNGILELHFNQWKNTHSVWKWFIDISNIKYSSFIHDIKEFYPTINKNILANSIQFEKLRLTIGDEVSI